MKSKTRLSIAGAVLASAAAIFALFSAPAFAGSGAKDAPSPEVKSPGLSGIELWTIHCNRCHTYRGSNEFTAAQWQNLILHMRVRANLPAAQAREILKFLQQGAGK
jgi:hypothetical protein